MPNDSPTPGCIDESKALDLLEGRLVPPDAAAVRSHAAACGECRRLLAGVARVVDGEGSGSDGHGPTLEGTPDEVAPPRAPDIRPGARVGSYSVLAQIGAGGMGIVYAAYDPDLDRRIALKLLHRDAVRPDRSERLRREAQAMAKLSHPNVVTVHEVGESKHGVYVAMEYVEGSTLDDWLSEREREWQQVLEVFIATGRGLAAAHVGGVVHRDFKPHNVLVADDGRPRVLDFGLAISFDNRESDSGEWNSEDAARLTRTGTVMGTPAYMAPEQFAGQRPDARSDQFSFCVALYEGLWGERPFEGDTYASLATAVSEGNVRPPNPDSKTPAWLRRIVLRGLAVEPDGRYPSMDVLIDALADDPLHRRRRRLGVAGAVAVVVGAGWGARELVVSEADSCSPGRGELAAVWDADTKVAVEQALLGTEVSYASSTWKRVEAALDDYARAWHEERTSACEASRDGREPAERSELRSKCLERARVELESLVAALSHEVDASVVRRAAGAVTQLMPLARCHDVEAAKARLQLPPDPAVADEVEALGRDLTRADTLFLTGRYDEALARVQEVENRARAIGYAPLAAEALYYVGSVQDARGDLDEAERILSEAYYASIGCGADRFALRAAVELVFLIGLQRSRPEEAFAWARSADALLRRLDGDRSFEAGLVGNVGMVLYGLGRYDEARRMIERTLAMRESLHGSDDSSIATVLDNLGGLMAVQGELESARTTLERAVQIREARYGGDHPRMATTLGNLAATLQRLGHLEQAERRALQALTIVEAAYGPEHPIMIQSLANLASLRKVRGRVRDAQQLLERARTIQDRQTDTTNAGIDTELASVLVELGDLGAAREILLRTLASIERAFGPEHPNLTNALRVVGVLEHRAGRLVAARSYLARALAIEQHSLRPFHPELCFTHRALGDVLSAEGQHRTALSHLELALSIAGRELPDNSSVVAQARFSLAKALVRADGDAARARELARQARAGFVDLQNEQAEVESWLRRHAQ